jgi:hypothetical protein
VTTKRGCHQYGCSNGYRHVRERTAYFFSYACFPATSYEYENPCWINNYLYRTHKMPWLRVPQILQTCPLNLSSRLPIAFSSTPYWPLNSLNDDSTTSYLLIRSVGGLLAHGVRSVLFMVTWRHHCPNPVIDTASCVMLHIPSAISSHQTAQLACRWHCLASLMTSSSYHRESAPGTLQDL